jgi:hypothetical protein
MIHLEKNSDTKPVSIKTTDYLKAEVKPTPEMSYQICLRQMGSIQCNTGVMNQPYSSTFRELLDNSGPPFIKININH